jgi:predicted signal transduction protein with EAL and GGDEF domain
VVLASLAEALAVRRPGLHPDLQRGHRPRPGHGHSADELLRHAESAVRSAKAAGSNNLRFHQQHAEGDLRSHMQLDHAMRQALASTASGCTTSRRSIWPAARWSAPRR